MAFAPRHCAASKYNGVTVAVTAGIHPHSAKLINSKDINIVQAGINTEFRQSDARRPNASTTHAELSYVTASYNKNRPSVINYFHGNLTTANSEATSPNHDQPQLPSNSCNVPESPTEPPRVQNDYHIPALNTTENIATIPDQESDASNNGYAEEKRGHNIEQDHLSSSQQVLEGNEQCRCKKRHRTSYSSIQLKRLEEEFENDNYIIGMKRWRLSEELDIPEKQIKIWFQNRRTKSKKNNNYSKDYNCLSPSQEGSIIGLYEDGDDF